MMLDKAQLLELTPAEMTVLVGGMRSLGISATGEGVWTDGNSLDNSWFSTLLDMALPGLLQDQIAMKLKIVSQVKLNARQVALTLFLAVTQSYVPLQKSTLRTTTKRSLSKTLLQHGPRLWIWIVSI